MIKGLEKAASAIEKCAVGLGTRLAIGTAGTLGDAALLGGVGGIAGLPVGLGQHLLKSEKEKQKEGLAATLWKAMKGGALVGAGAGALHGGIAGFGYPQATIDAVRRGTGISLD